MKSAEIIKTLSKVFRSNSIEELNKILKSKHNEGIKFKIMGQSLGYRGYTVVLKMITKDGIKFFDVNRVRLIRFDEIESFEKAKPKVPRPVYDGPKPVKVKPKSGTKNIKMQDDDDDDWDEDDWDDEDFDFEEKPKKKSKPAVKNKSKFIPQK